jgi:hypothetical protein
MQVKPRQPFVERLLLAQGFDALCAPSRVEFTFLNTVARGKPNKGRTENSTANTQTEKEQKPMQRMPEQFRGFFTFDHFNWHQRNLIPFSTGSERRS